MRTAYRVLSTAVAVGAIFPIGIPSAHADTSDVKVEFANWFWSGQTYGTGPNDVPYPAIPYDATGVPKGGLPVSFKGETETTKDGGTIAKPDKESYLAWDVYFIPEGSYVDSFTFTLFVDDKATQAFVPEEIAVPGQTERGGQPAIIACVPTIGFGPGDGAEPYQLKPEDDCTDQIFGTYDEKTNSYTFDASTYAQDWVDGKENNGLGIRPSIEATDPFQLVFKGAADVKASITYTPAEAEPTAPPIVYEPVPMPPLPPTDTSVFVPNEQPVPQPQPQVQPTPVVVKTKAPVVLQNVAASPLSASRGLSPVFWFAMIGGVLLLGVTSLILGDPLEAAAGSRSRVRSTGRHRLNTPATVPVRATRPVRPRIV